MLKKNGVKEERKGAIKSVGDAFIDFIKLKGGDEQLGLLRLWDNWEEVVGSDIASIAKPTGHKDKTLLLLTANSVALQELLFSQDEILLKVNTFLGSEFFLGLRVSLPQGKKGLRVGKVSSVKKLSRSNSFEVPKNLGGLVGKLNPDSPITKCYEAYVKALLGSK